MGKTENWLNNLISKEKANDNIVAVNFGLYETKDSIQLYISGSKEWELDDGDWACNNDYFPGGRYTNVALYDELYKIMNNNFEVGLLLQQFYWLIRMQTLIQLNCWKEKMLWYSQLGLAMVICTILAF